MLACPYGKRYLSSDKGDTVKKKELCEYVKSVSQALANNGKGVGLFADWHSNEIYIEFGDMTLEEITDDVIRVEATCLKLITEDAIEAFKSGL